MEVLNYMVKYKVNLKFKENAKSLNTLIIDLLKIEVYYQNHNFQIIVE